MKHAAPGTEGSAVTFAPRYENFIGGQWVAPTAGRYFENPTPITGQVFCEIARSDESDIDKALDAAHAATRWRQPQRWHARSRRSAPGGTTRRRATARAGSDGHLMV